MRQDLKEEEFVMYPVSKREIWQITMHILKWKISKWERQNLILKSGLLEKKVDEWNLSFIINLYMGKGDSLDRGNSHGLKLLEQVLKTVERILESIIREQVSIDNIQFGFMPGRGTTDAIFILRQMHEKHIARKKDIFFAFVDLEKAFDRVPRNVLWWAMRKLGVEEWVIRTVKAMPMRDPKSG